MTPYSIALGLHITVGSVALIAFWLTAALRKGAQLHRRVGGTYLIAMVGVTLTALPLAGHAFVTQQPVLGVFFLYLVVITATALWSAWRAIRDRKSITAFMGRWYRPAAWVNLACGGVVLATGLYAGSALLDGMCAIGFYAGIQMLRFAASPPKDRMWWLQRHYKSIVASGIAAHVAFLNIGLQRLLPVRFADTVQYLAWFGPVIVAAATIRWLDRRYRTAARHSSPAIDLT